MLSLVYRHAALADLDAIYAYIEPDKILASGQNGASLLDFKARAFLASHDGSTPMSAKMLDQAIAKAHELPEADQERIGRELIDYIDHLQALREDINQGLRSLDAGLGRQLDIEEVIARARASHAGA